MSTPVPKPPDPLDDLKQPPSGLPVPNTGEGSLSKPLPPRPPAVMGPSSATNGRPPTPPPVMGQTVGQSASQPQIGAARSPRSPFNLPGPPPGPLDLPAYPAQEPPAAPAPPAAPQPPSPETIAPQTPTVAAPGAVQRPVMVPQSTVEIPSGQNVDTPVGTAYKDPTTGRTATTLNSAGQAGYQRAYASQLRRFGSYYGMDDPDHPKPPITPGYPVFNPDTGQWVD